MADAVWLLALPAAFVGSLVVMAWLAERFGWRDEA